MQHTHTLCSHIENNNTQDYKAEMEILLTAIEHLHCSLNCVKERQTDLRDLACCYHTNLVGAML